MKKLLLVVLLVTMMAGCASEDEGYHSRDWDGDDSRCLAQLASYVAWNSDMEAKITIVNIAVNRVWADGYPGTIKEVVSDLTGGEYVHEDPDEECWDAVKHVQIDGWDLSDGATEFTIENGQVIPETGLSGAAVFGLVFIIIAALVLICAIFELVMELVEWKEDE